MNLAVKNARLNPRGVDELLSEFLSGIHASAECAEVAIDLGALRFIDPYGLVSLCLMGRYARTVVPRVFYRLPLAVPLRSYLGRVRFDHALDGIEIEGPALLVDEDREKADSESLLELTRIQAQADVESLLGHIGLRVEVILAEELLYTAVEINQFKNVIAELCHNILDHSMNWGYVTAQRYMDPRLRKKYVVIGVGDLGIGIKKSLAQRHDVSDWTHGAAIKNSLKQNFSRDDNRGLGLYIVNQICDRYRGSLHMRTGDTRLYIRGRKQSEYPSVHFPGTQVAIALYQRDS